MEALLRKVLISLLSVLLLSFLVGCQESDSGDSSDDSSSDSAKQQQALEEAQREVTQAREEAEEARQEAEEAREEASEASEQDAGGEEVATEPASEEQSENTPERSPSETLRLQYDYMGSGQYEEAYYMLAEQSQRLVSLEQYVGFFPSSYEVSEYSVNSEQINGDTATVQADLVVTDSQRGVQQYPITQEFVLVEDEWRVILRDEQVETFTAVQEPEQDTPDSESSEQNTIPGDGTFIVGEDIQPGTYETEGSEYCYWERLSGTSGTMDDVIANGVPTGPAIITISPSDEAFLTEGCSEWTLR